MSEVKNDESHTVERPSRMACSAADTAETRSEQTIMTKQEEIEELEAYKEFMEAMQAEGEEIGLTYKCPVDPHENHFAGQAEYANARLEKLRSEEKEI